MTSGVDLLWIAALYLVIASSYLPAYVALTSILPVFLLLKSVTSLVSSSALVPSIACQNATVVTPLALSSTSAAGALRGRPGRITGAPSPESPRRSGEEQGLGHIRPGGILSRRRPWTPFVVVFTSNSRDT